MKRIIFVVLFLFSGVLAASSLRPAARTEPKGVKMHPAVTPLTKSGQNAVLAGEAPDPKSTCGECHDVVFIRSHSSHMAAGVGVDCFDCHVDGEEKWSPDILDEDGAVPANATGIHAADNRSCSTCHGIQVAGAQPAKLPDDFERNTQGEQGHDPYGLTRYTGTVYSGRAISRSNMNIENRAALNFAWDVHARRMVGCTDCHHASNNPSKAALKRTMPSHLKRDPRSMSVSDYIHRPNHGLESPECTFCHNPQEAHDFLPHKDRHMAVLDCQACHVPTLYTPVVSYLDNTVLDMHGVPVSGYRNVEESGRSINARQITPVSPYLLPYETETGHAKVGAFNLVAHWRWVEGATNTPVPAQTLAKVFPRTGDKDHDPAVLQALDSDKNGRLSRDELLLDTPAKVAAVYTALQAQGVQSPEIRSEVKAHRMAHGVLENEGVLRECEACHGENSRFGAPVEIAPALPGGVAPDVDKSVDRLTHGAVVSDNDGVRWQRSDSKDPFYVFGHSRVDWSDQLGFLLFILSFLGILSHGGYRLYTRKGRSKKKIKTERVYMYTLYERIWHWLMAASVVVLLLTGLQIHYPGKLNLSSFGIAVTVHNFAAIVLVTNAFLSLFFHLATAAIKNFIPQKEGLLPSLVAQVRYYTHGIFLGHEHPTTKTAQHKLNPLQQLTYLGLLNVLFPFQVITGVAIWAVSRWPAPFEPMGGLTVLGPVHNLGSWLFLTFLVVHLYLTTTGHTVFSNLSAMVDGYDEIEAPETDANGGSDV